MIRTSLTCAIFLALVSGLGCGDSTEQPGGSSNAGGDAPGGSGVGGTSNGGSGTGGQGTGGVVDPGPTELVGDVSINEVQPYAVEWVELANATGSAIDLAGYGLCDEDVNGACDTAKMMRFPAGATLDADGYLVVLSDQAESGVLVTTGCPAPVTSCYTAQWKVSGADGETLRLVDADDVLVAAFTYPAGATADDTESWARTPDVSGPGSVSTPTPGAANE